MQSRRTLVHRKRRRSPSLTAGQDSCLSVENLEKRYALAVLATPVLESAIRPPQVQPGSSRTAEEFVAVGDRLFFTAASTSGTELWALNRSTGVATMVIDLMPGFDSSFPHYLTATQTKLFFIATDPTGTYVWQSDGTSAGTSKVDAIGKISAAGRPVTLGPDRVVLALRAETQKLDESSLWISDGSTDGTVKLTPDSTVRSALDVTPVSTADHVYFSVQSKFPEGGSFWRGELWRTDGTPTATMAVAAPSGSQLGTFSSTTPSQLVVAETDIFLISPGAAIPLGGGSKASLPDVWRFDTASEGLVRVTNSDNDAVLNGNFHSLTPWGGDLFFAATVNEVGLPWKLFVADGKGPGVRPVANAPQYPNSLTAVHEALYFTADSYDTSVGNLWRFDGTVIERVPGSRWPTTSLVSFGGLVYADSGRRLARLDATTGQMQELSQVSLRFDPFKPITVFAENAFFWATSASGFGTDSLYRYKLANSITITSDRPFLKVGEAAAITFTLDASSTNFTVDDVSLSSGSLSNFRGSGSAYTATYVPAAGFTGTVNIAVPTGVFTDETGTQNAAGSLLLSVDTVAPTCSVTRTGSGTLNVGATATIMFTLSEASANFVATDVTVTGGTISNFSGSGTSYSATFTPAANLLGTATVTVNAATFADAAGNDNTAGNTVSMTVDTVVPTVAMTRAGFATLKTGDTDTITFRLSEASANFVATDVTATGGTISNFSGSGTSYTATFTPAATFQGTASITVAAGAFTNATGNPNPASSLAVPVDSVRPTVTISRAGVGTLKIGSTDTITFTLNEAGTTFGLTNVTSTGGTLSGFSGSGTTYTATFTPNASFTGNASIGVAAGVFSDSSGNPNLATSSISIAVDTVAPTIVITWSGSSPLLAEGTATVTFTLSEPANDFSSNDVTVANGTLSGFGGSGTTYTATFIPTPQFKGTGTISVAAGSFTDSSGNGIVTPATATIPVDTVAPYIVRFTSPTVATTLRINESMTLIARFSQQLAPADGHVGVRLNSGATVRLTLDAGGMSASGIYTVQPGDFADFLDVVAVVPNATLTNSDGRKILSAVPSPSFSTTHAVVVDGIVKMQDPGSGFSMSPALVRDLGGPQRIPLNFTTPVTGVTAASFRLWLNNSPLSLVGARIEGAGGNYVLVLPPTRVRPFGIFRLDIVPGASIRASVNGALVSPVASQYWGNRQSISMLPDAPSGLTVQRSASVRGRTTAILAWQTPRTNGGGAISEYLVDYRVAGMPNWIRVRTTIQASTTPGTAVQGLVAGVAYEFRVAAKSSAGVGQYATTRLLVK
jgi:ELWxxDGT repeat protein